MYGMMRLSAKTPSKNQEKKKTKMFNKGDAVSVLDGNNQWSGYFDQRSGVTIETEDGFVMTFFCQ
jgi:hypothetical protein